MRRSPSSHGLARLLAGMLYGVSPHDPLTLSGVVIVVLVVAAPHRS